MTSRFNLFLPSLCALCALGGGLRAQTIAVYPPDINLETARDRQSFVVQLTQPDGLTRDVTGQAQVTFANPALVRLDKFAVLPVADGATEMAVAFAGQTVKVLGSFLAKTSGFTFQNVPLTDGAGLNRLKLRLSGKVTLRLRTLTADNDTGNRYLNYLIAVPVADAGVQLHIAP